MNDWLYTPGKGFLYRLDPRTKFLFVTSLFVYLALTSATRRLLIALLLLHILCVLSKSTLRRIGPLWKSLAPLLITIVVLGSVRWRAEQPLFHIGPVTITTLSLWTALGLGARIAALTVAVSLLLWTTDPGDAVAGLTRLGLPFELGFPVIMVLQYVATFRQVFNQILEAQQSRGLVVPRGNPLRTARAYIPVLIPLLIHALRSVDELNVALQSRGFGMGQKRTSRRTLCMKGRDWLFLIGTCCTMIALSQV